MCEITGDCGCRWDSYEPTKLTEICEAHHKSLKLLWQKGFIDACCSKAVSWVGTKLVRLCEKHYEFIDRNGDCVHCACLVNQQGKVTSACAAHLDFARQYEHSIKDAALQSARQRIDELELKIYRLGYKP